MSQANAIINVDINTSGAAASLRKLQTQINSFQSALNKNNVQQAASARDYSNQLSNLVNSSQFFSAETVRMRTSAGQLDETLSKGKGSIAQYFNSFRKGSAQAAQVMSLANARAAALQTQFVATGAAAGGYRESLAIRPLQAFNAAAAVSGEKLAIQRAMLTQASTHMINFGKNTQWAGRQLMVGFTVPLSIFGALAGKTFMELEKQAISFKKVYGDSFTTPEELEENMKAVSKLSVEYTKYGIAASKTMELAAQAAAMGAQGATLTDAITESTKLATLGQMEQTKALETTIALQNAFGLSGEKLAKSVNFLNMVENQTVVTLQDLAEAIPRVAPVIKGLGGSVEDMAAMIAAMKEGGVSAAQGANALKSGLASLINPSNKASESLKKVGIDINQIVNTNRGDLMGTVQDFGKALSSLDKLGQQQALEKVFGKYQYARLGALFNNIIKDGTQASKVLEMTTLSAQQLQATADKELKVITDSPATKFTAALEKLKVSIAPIGEMFVKLATPIVSFISKIAEGFNNLPDFAKKFLALGTVLIGVVIPAGTMFLGLLMNLGGTLVKFTHIIGVALKGLTTGGLSGAVRAVSESLKYMSLAEMDTSVASQQLAKSSEMVTSALLAQVPSATQATAAISALGREYATLAIRMREASALGGVPFVVPGAAFDQAGRLPTQTPRVPRRLRRNKGGGIPYLNDGGNSTVPGMGNTDTVPAMLTPGEFVVNKKATSANLPLLHAINSRAPGFNSGGQIPGMQYFGFRNRQRSVQPMDDIDVPMESFFASARNSMAKKVQVQSSTKSASLYDKLLAKYPEGTNSKVDAIRTAVALGIPVESLNLKSRGNFAFRMSDRANQEMMLGKLTRNSLLDELEFEGAHVPLERQMKSYFGPTFTLDRDIFNRIYREEIAKLPEIGINNRRFEKASRNSLTRYMIETGVPRDQRKNFIRDILQQDSVSSNLSKPELLRTLDMKGIEYRESGKDVYATVDGKEIKLGHLLGREIADLGRPKGIRPFAGAGSNIESPAGYANVHANKGGMIPAMQYFATRIKQRVVQPRTFTHLVKGATEGIEKPPELEELEAFFGQQARPISGAGLNLDSKFGINEALLRGIEVEAPDGTVTRRPVTGKEIKAAVAGSKKPYQRLVSDGRSEEEIEKIKLAVEAMGDDQGFDDDILNNYIRSVLDPESSILNAQGFRLSKGIGIKALKALALSGKTVYREHDVTTGKGTRHVAVKLPDGRIISYETRGIGTDGGINQQGGKNYKVHDSLKGYETWVGDQNRTTKQMQMGGIIPGVPGLHKGALFLGMPHPFKSLTRSNEIRETLARTNILAQSGRSLGFPLMQTGSMESGLGGHSSSIPGNGIYNMKDGRYVLKFHNTLESALAEGTSSSLMRNPFGLESPKQEVVRVLHPETGDMVFAVRSPFDPTIASSTGGFERGNFAQQLIASVVRRDSDLQPDNVFGNVVADNGASIFGMNEQGRPRASQPRIIGDNPISAIEQLDINLLKTAGGAKKFFAESSADIAREMSADEYQDLMKATISNARARTQTAVDDLPNLTEAERTKYLSTILNDLDQLDAVDWKAMHGHHIGLFPAQKKTPTAAAIKKAEEAAAKKEADEVLRIRQRGHNQSRPYGLNFINSGGIASRIQYLMAGARVKAKAPIKTKAPTKLPIEPPSESTHSWEASGSDPAWDLSPAVSYFLRKNVKPIKSSSAEIKFLQKRGIDTNAMEMEGLADRWNPKNGTAKDILDTQYELNMEEGVPLITQALQRGATDDEMVASILAAQSWHTYPQEELSKVVSRLSSSQLYDLSRGLATLPENHQLRSLIDGMLPEVKALMREASTAYSDPELGKAFFALASMKNQGGMIPGAPGYMSGSLVKMMQPVAAHGIESALRTWQNSSNYARQSPRLLDSFKQFYLRSTKPRTLHRATTLGLSRGSEFNSEDHQIIFDALESGDYSNIIGREFEINTPASYSNNRESTLSAFDSNDDVNKIALLRNLREKNRRKNEDRKAMIERRERSIARGVRLTESEIKRHERDKEYILNFDRDQGLYDEDIKRLAPRGYRMVHIEQNFREDDRLLDVNRQNMLNNQEGTFMGRSVSSEQEYIAPPSTVRISGVSTDPETGFTKLILETLIQRRNAGGSIFESGPSNKIVPGVGSTDTVPAMLTPGEFVINKKATSANMQLLRAINNGTLRGYTEGDIVSDTTTHPLTGDPITTYAVKDADGNLSQPYETEAEAQRESRRMLRNSRRSRRSARMGGAMNKVGMAGMAMSMASMLPMLMPSNPETGEPGKFLGLDSGTASMAMMGAGTAASLAPMLAGIATPAIAVAGALTALGAGLYIWRKSVDDAARAAATLGANLGGAANALGNMSKILGVESPLDRRRNLQLSVAPEQQELSNRFTQSFTEGEGKAFIDKLKSLTSEKQFSMLSDYIKVAIASGMMDRGAAEVFAKSVGSELKNVALATQGIATAKTAGVGSKAMLALAQNREETVSKNAEIQMVIDSNVPEGVNSASAAKAIAASTQIMKDFSAAQVLAEEELRNNTLSYEEYRKVVDTAADATKTWGSVITKANLNTDDFGATAQGSIQSMILAGFSPEQVEVLANATDVGQTNMDQGFNNDTTYQNESGKFNKIESGSLADIRLLDKVREAGFNSPDEMVAKGERSAYNKLAIDAVAEQSAARTMTGFDPESGKKIKPDFLLDAMEGAIAGGMDATQAFNLVKNILADPLGEAATHFTKAGLNAQSFAESLSVANAEIDIPNLSDSQQTQYEDISNSLLGGFQEQFRTYIASSTNPAVALKNVEEIAGTGQARLSGNELDKARSKFFTDQEKMGRGSIANTVQSSKAYKDALQERKTVTEYNEKGKKVTSQGFDSTGVDKISNAVVNAQKSEVSESVITYAVTLNGEEVDVANKINELTLAHNELIDLPEDFILGIGLDLTNGADVESFGKISDDLKMLIPTLDALPEEARAIMVNFGVKANGKAMSPEDFAKKSARVLKALENLDSTKKSVKKSAIVSLLQEIKVNGKTMSKEAADSAYSDLIDKYGEKKIMNLPGDVLHKVIMIETEIQGLNEYINKLNSAIALDPGGASPEERRARNALQAKVAAAKNIQRATIASGLNGGGDSGGGGGGEKSIAQQLKEQAKLSEGTFKGISKLQNEKGFKKFIAGPFAPEFLEYLRSQGAAGLKLIKGGLEKVKAAYANYQKSKISEGAAMAALTPQALVQESKKVALSSQYNQRLAGQGMSAEDIDAVRQYVPDEDLLYVQQLKRKKKDKGTSRKEKREINQELEAFKREREAAERDAPLISQAQKTAESITDMTTETTLLKTQLDFINEGKTPELAAAMAAAGLKAGDATENVEKYTKAYNELKAAEYAADPGKLDQEKRDNLMEIADINRQIDEINLIRPLEDQVEIQQKIIDGQEKIVRGKQQEIDVIGRGIELKQRELEPLDDQIEKLQELSDKTSEAYDNQIEALDKIYEREAQIDKLKQGQLNVAQALSRGDVAGAAQAAMAASQDIAERSRQEARSALESQKEVATKNIQNQILEIEKQKKAINKEIEDLQMKQRAIQDDIYTIQSTLILPAENKIYELQGLINIEADKLAGKYKNAAHEMENLKAKLKDLLKDQDRLNNPGASAGGAAAPAPPPVLPPASSYQPGSAPNATQSAAVAAQFSQPVLSNAAKLNQAAAAGQDVTKLGFTKADWVALAQLEAANKRAGFMYGGNVKKMMFGGRVGYKGSTEPPPRMMNYGGMMKKYAYGSMVPGRGMTDKVPALLTPGEFIIRKSVSETYGPMLSALNSQVFPKMNLNSSIPTLGNKDDDGSVYNYQISVSLNGSNLDPNDVANAVMQKIKMSENKGVRSNNIRG